VSFQESTNPSGLIGGLQFGYNWQSVSKWVFGVEADIQGAGESGSGDLHQNAAQLARLGIRGPGGIVNVTLNTSQSISQSDGLRWFGTVRGRIGYAILPTAMVYGTGGLAYGGVNDSVAASYNLAATCSAACTGTATLANGTVVPLPFAGNQIFNSGTRTGWTLGGGVAGVVPNTRVTWKVEYLFIDLGTANYVLSGPALGTIAVNTRFVDNIARIGLNYQFR
jgi:outer membrane immunogenic protein